MYNITNKLKLNELMKNRILNSINIQYILYKNNILKTWSTITRTLNSTNNIRDIPQIYQNDTIIQAPAEPANAFNGYFIDIGSNLADQKSSEETFDNYPS